MFTWNNSAIRSFAGTQDKRDLLAWMLFVQKAEGNFLQVDTSSQILRIKGFVRQVVFSTENCRKCTMQKFTYSQIPFYVWEKERWTSQKSSSPKDGGLSRVLQGNRKENWWTTNSIHILHFLGSETDKVPLRIHEWIREGEGEHGQILSPETCLHRVIFMGDERNFDFFKGTERR